MPVKTKKDAIEVYGFKGLRHNAPPTMIGNEFFIDCNEVVCREFTVGSSPGIDDFPINDGSMPLLGTVISIYEYHRPLGGEYLIIHTDKETYSCGFIGRVQGQGAEGYVLTPMNPKENLVAAGTWVAEANVSVSLETQYIIAAGSVSKIEISDAFGTGLAAYTNVSSVDISDRDSIHVYLKSSIATSAGDLQLLIDDSNGCGSPLNSLDIPALPKNRWVSIHLEMGPTGSLTAILSYGLKVITDLGAMDVSINYIVATTRFDEGRDSLISQGSFITVSGTNLYVFTLWLNGIYKSNQGGVISTLTGWTSYSSKIIIDFGERLIAFYTREGSNLQPLRIRWSVAGDIEDTTGTGSGFNDALTELRGGAIISVAKMGDALIIYGKRAIVIMRLTGDVTAPFTWETAVGDIEAVSQKCVLPVDDFHIVLLSNGLFIYRGGSEVVPLDDGLNEELISKWNRQYLHRAFLVYDKEHSELSFHLPMGSSTNPDTYYRYNFTYKTWVKGSKDLTAAGAFKIPAVFTAGTVRTITIDDLSAAISTYDNRIMDWVAGREITVYGDGDGKVWQSSTGWNVKGSAQDSWFQTKYFSVDKYLREGAVWMQIAFEGRGEGSVEVQYTEDKGALYTLLERVTLTDRWTNYEVDFEVTANTFGVKFRNASLNEWFEIRSLRLEKVNLSRRGF